MYTQCGSYKYQLYMKATEQLYIMCLLVGSRVELHTRDRTNRVNEHTVQAELCAEIKEVEVEILTQILSVYTEDITAQGSYEVNCSVPLFCYVDLVRDVTKVL